MATHAPSPAPPRDVNVGARLRADVSRREVVPLSALAWSPSPIPGVERRMLERVGDEIARATSIVRYQPGSRFTPHVHDAGEEFLVLEGVFADEHGAYPVGAYVRNPPGSRHSPFTDAKGCTIFVKLRQFQPDDDARVVVDTRAGRWRTGDAPGVSVLPLHEHRGERVALVRLDPGAARPEGPDVGGEELLVLAGALEDEGGVHPARTWLRNPPGRRPGWRAPAGCLLYVKVGHLVG